MILSKDISAYDNQRHRDTLFVEHKLCKMHPKPSTSMTSLHSLPPHCM